MKSNGPSFFRNKSPFAVGGNAYTQFATEQMVGKGEDHFLLGFGLFSGAFAVSFREVSSICLKKASWRLV